MGATRTIISSKVRDIAVNVFARSWVIKVVFLLLLSALSVPAQSEKVDCPQIRLSSPGRLTQPEDKAVIAVALSGGSGTNSSVSYDWFVSAGKIVLGRGTEAIEVLTGEENAGSNIKVAVLVHGLPKECPASAVAEFGVASYPIGEPVDQFYDMQWGKDRYFLESRLDNYFAAITNNPGYVGFITIEFDKKDSLTSKIVYLQRIYRHVAFRKFDPARITFALAEYKGKTMTTLWTMHPKAKVPKWARSYRIIKAENYRNRVNCIFPID